MVFFPICLFLTSAVETFTTTRVTIIPGCLGEMFQDTIVITLIVSISALYASDCLMLVPIVDNLHFVWQTCITACATKLLITTGVPIQDPTLLAYTAAVYALYGINCKAYAEVVTNELLDSGIIDIINSIS